MGNCTSGKVFSMMCLFERDRVIGRHSYLPRSADVSGADSGWQVIPARTERSEIWLDWAGVRFRVLTGVSPPEMFTCGFF